MEPPVAPGRVVLVKRFVMRDGAAVGTRSAMLFNNNNNNNNSGKYKCMYVYYNV